MICKWDGSSRNIAFLIATVCISFVFFTEALGSIECSSDSMLVQYYHQLLGRADSVGFEEMIECLKKERLNFIDSAVIAFNQGENHRVLELLEGLSEQTITDKERLSDFYFLRGMSHLRLGQLNAALKDFDCITSNIGYKNAINYSHKAFCLNALKRYEEGLVYADSALALMPNFASAWNNRGHSLSGLGRQLEASDSYDSSLAHNPASVETRNNKALNLFLLGRYNEARAHADTAILFDSKFGQAWQTRGLCYQSIGEMETAVLCFDRALSLGISNERLWAFRGLALEQLQKNNEALESYDSCLNHNKENFAAWGNRGIILDKLGRDVEALESYDKSLAIDRRQHMMWYNRGGVLFELGRLREALFSYDSAIAYGNRDVQTYMVRGDIFDSLGRFLEANESYDSALAIDHTVGWIWLRKSILMIEFGDSCLPDVWRALDSAVYYDSSLTSYGRDIQQEILKILEKHGKKIPGIE